MSGAKEVVFHAPECPVDRVTVYPDRAEVRRRVEASLPQGLNQVVITKLPDRVYSDSIRVEGAGAATITEVMFHSEKVATGQGDISAQELLTRDYEGLKRSKRIVESGQTVVKKQLGLLDSFATAVAQGVTATTTGNGDRVISAKSFNGLTDFLRSYACEGNSLEMKQLDLDQRLVAVEKEIDANRTNYEKRTKVIHDSSDEIRKCVIVLDCKESCEVSLLVSYVTDGASWKPSYDIRMNVDENVLKITYYGQIQQSTGEDWVDAKLFLSTAMLSIGGEIPDLYTAVLNLNKSTRSGLASAGRFPKEPIVCEVPLQEHSLVPSPPPAVAHAETKVGIKTWVTSMYEIVQRSNVPSDGAQHKVTVGLIDVEPKISYTSVPQLIPHAFMLAKITNNSPYTMLSGETSIFLDNNFVGKASLKDVHPMEEFDFSLGVDPAVKVTYKPLKKFKATSDILSKVVTYEQMIEVKNTHDFPIHIVVKDQLPRSTDDRIKVHLLEPRINLEHPAKSQDKEALLNKDSIMEWTVDLEAQETREILLKYTVEHPVNSEPYKDVLFTSEQLKCCM